MENQLVKTDGNGGGAARRTRRRRVALVVRAHEVAIGPESEYSPAGRLLATAMDLLYREGIRAVGVDRLILEAGVAKATFYSHYRSKQALVCASLEGWDTAWMTMIDDHVELYEPGSADRLFAVFDFLQAASLDPAYRGSPFANALAETGADEDVRRICRRHADRMRRKLERLAQETGVADAPAVASSLALVIDGAMVAAVRDGGSKAVGTARAMAETLTGRRRAADLTT